MKSMTGFGHGEVAAEGFKIVIEIRSVNRKQAEVSLSVPAELEALEARIRDSVNRRVARGRCEVRIRFDRPTAQASNRINRVLAASYAAEWTALGVSLGLTGVAAIPSLDLLARCPGVLQNESVEIDSEQAWTWVQPALDHALNTFDAMRRREGEALSLDLESRIALMREGLDRIGVLAPEVIIRYREQLLQRVRSALHDGVLPDDERLLKEVVIFADRSDISEEITRLRSHFEQFADCTRSTDSVGRKLDFLAQEMNREINTIGSKANDERIGVDVVGLKTELERFREQAQNIE